MSTHTHPQRRPIRIKHKQQEFYNCMKLVSKIKFSIKFCGLIKEKL